MHRNKRTYLLRLVFSLLLVSLVCGCVGKKPDDDVALIKGVLGRFERGIARTSQTVLDSIVLDKKQNLSLQFLDSLSLEKKLVTGRIAEKNFTIVKDSAEVKLRLSLEYFTGAEETEVIERAVTLFLQKKKGEWRISRFVMPPDERKPQGN